jgi:hypothetical protein
MVLLALSDCNKVSLPLVESGRSIVQHQRIQQKTRACCHMTTYYLALAVF